MAIRKNRREFLRDLGIGAAAVPFLLNLPSLGLRQPAEGRRKQRLVVLFSPNGVFPDDFWPDEEGATSRAQADPQAARAVQGPDADRCTASATRSAATATTTCAASAAC